ncbi:kirola-like [Rhododendron vialii]|uniref:kirola-like n=1 Tax=Rhododendron vialii TaxID=182163 RepID=UPI00265F04C7|nr:kirola-like [Rhododendron vialii]
MSPGNIRNVEFPQGNWGTVGSVIVWHYNQDGKEKTDKAHLEVIDEENKLMTLTAVEGDLLQQYKTYRVTMQVDTKGENHSGIWALEYEKLSEDVEDPTTFMDMLVGVTKDIEVHHLNQCTN